MARLFRIEAPVAELALPLLVVAVGRAVIEVLIVRFPVGERAIAWAAVSHVGRHDLGQGGEFPWKMVAVCVVWE